MPRKLLENPSKVLILLVLSLCPAQTWAAGEGEGKHTAGLEIGQVWPSGEIGKDVDGNVAPGIFYEYAASEVFSLYSSVIRSTHSDQKLKLTSTDVGIKANLVYYDRLSPYAFLGMGLYFVNKTVSPTNENASKALFGFNLGVGADLDLSDLFFVGMQFTIHNMFANHVDLPAAGRTELSGRWAGFFLRTGVRF